MLTRQDVLFVLVVKEQQKIVLDVKESIQNGKIGVPGHHAPNPVWNQMESKVQELVRENVFHLNLVGNHVILKDSKNMKTVLVKVGL